MKSETARLEFFSDAVFAIAITLLILDVKIPPREEQVIPALLHEWPSSAAFLVSFASIGAMWVNHHRLFLLIRKADDTLLVLNLLVLLGVTVVPFSTGLLAEHMRGPDQRIAALLYNGTFLYTALAFGVLWRYASTHELLGEDATVPVYFYHLSRRRVGPILYLICVIIAWFDARASFIANAATALFFALVPTVMGDRRHSLQE